VGHLESVYALGVAIGAPAFVAAGIRFGRRAMLLLTTTTTTTLGPASVNQIGGPLTTNELIVAMLSRPRFDHGTGTAAVHADHRDHEHAVHEVSAGHHHQSHRRVRAGRRSDRAQLRRSTAHRQRLDSGPQHA
jgi:hypothetical protein